MNWELIINELNWELQRSELGVNYESWMNIHMNKLHLSCE